MNDAARGASERGGVRSAWAEVPALAHHDPRSTAFMRHRAREGGRPPEPIRWTSLEEVAPHVVCAVVKAEDPEFFRHRGIAWGFLWRAVRDAARGAPWRGASTITQQLARNLFLAPDRRLTRKLKEAVLAIRLERTLSKRRILELYLNLVEWGDGVWGVGAAARHYRGCTPAQLGVFGAVVLASLLPAPRQPLRGANAARALTVQRRVAAALYGSSVLGRDDYRELLVRAESFAEAMHFQVPVAVALARLDTGAPAVGPRGPLSVGAVLRDGCGYADERHFIRHLREVERRGAPLGELPPWWGERGVAGKGLRLQPRRAGRDG